MIVLAACLDQSMHGEKPSCGGSAESYIKHFVDRALRDPCEWWGEGASLSDDLDLCPNLGRGQAAACRARSRQEFRYRKSTFRKLEMCLGFSHWSMLAS